MTISSSDTIDTTLLQDGQTNAVSASRLRTLGNSSSGFFVQTARTGNITLALTDRGTLIPMNVASANTVTVPPNSTVAFDIGVVVGARQQGAGATTIVAGAGVTLRTCSPDTLVLRGQYARAFMHKVGTNEWDVYGQLT